MLLFQLLRNATRCIILSTRGSNGFYGVDERGLSQVRSAQVSFPRTPPMSMELSKLGKLALANQKARLRSLADGKTIGSCRQ